ncbi:MAG: zf-HC2 domain-containing protein [Cyanobacteriota bacterium]
MIEIADCEHIKLYLTEYSRGQLIKEDNNVVEEHIASCRECRMENEIFKTLSVEIDKLIPTVQRAYEKSIIYRLFIQHNEENIFFKLSSFLLILFFILFVVSSYYEKKINYISLSTLKFRAENIFNYDYYSGIKKDKSEN